MWQLHDRMETPAIFIHLRWREAIGNSKTIPDASSPLPAVPFCYHQHGDVCVPQPALGIWWRSCGRPAIKVNPLFREICTGLHGYNPIHIVSLTTVYVTVRAPPHMAGNCPIIGKIKSVFLHSSAGGSAMRNSTCAISARHSAIRCS